MLSFTPLLVSILNTAWFDLGPALSDLSEGSADLFAKVKDLYSNCEQGVIGPARLSKYEHFEFQLQGIDKKVVRTGNVSCCRFPGCLVLTVLAISACFTP